MFNNLKKITLGNRKQQHSLKSLIYLSPAWSSNLSICHFPRPNILKKALGRKLNMNFEIAEPYEAHKSSILGKDTDQIEKQKAISLKGLRRII